MRWRTMATTTLLACSALAAPAPAQVGAPEATILRQVAETYRTLRTYLFEGNIHVVVQGSGAPQIQDAPFLAVAGGGGRVRDQMTHATLGGMLLSNGRETIIYSASLGQYTRQPGPLDSVMAGNPNRGVAGMLIARYGAIETGAIAAKRLPDASVLLDGLSRNCVVLEVTYRAADPRIEESPRTFWIDPQTHLVLRQRASLKGEEQNGKVERQEEITLRRATLDPVLPDTIWVFRPPAGSRQVAEFTRPDPDADLSRAFTGRPAIDFTLKDLEGRPHSLKSLRGKVVLLDFWATWCGPCRITMPQVAKIHTEFKSRGVEVMSINVGEAPAAAGNYMRKNGYRFPTLLDQKHEVATRYRVNGIPTLVVIDRAGTVSDYLVGARDEADLRAALKKAGVK
jgi:thiol-disulfide isomerase/thioredoxin